MPKTIAALAGRQSAYVCLVLIHHLFITGVVKGQYIQYFRHGEYRPAIGSTPVKGRMITHPFNPAVAIEALFGYKHSFRELKNLANSLIVILTVSR
ncbi:hypothetical protein SDC9_176456 [bioreactor metagenome]|uniref:Uncharacterized protein n=1 Tax=bioreactor metagenome TaxID=1076179 RepID=A0A645GQ29_9ZZZZ